MMKNFSAEGVNNKQAYLGGLNIQVKGRYFPKIAQTDLKVAPSNLVQGGTGVGLLGTDRRERIPQNSFMQAEVPFAGAWFNRSQPPDVNTSPAGMRIPKPLKLTFTEKF